MTGEPRDPRDAEWVDAAMRTGPGRPAFQARVTAATADVAQYLPWPAFHLLATSKATVIPGASLLEEMVTRILLADDQYRAGFAAGQQDGVLGYAEHAAKQGMQVDIRLNDAGMQYLAEAELAAAAKEVPFAEQVAEVRQILDRANSVVTAPEGPCAACGHVRSHHPGLNAGQCACGCPAFERAAPTAEDLAAATDITPALRRDENGRFDPTGPELHARVTPDLTFHEVSVVAEGPDPSKGVYPITQITGLGIVVAQTYELPPGHVAVHVTRALRGQEPERTIPAGWIIGVRTSEELDPGTAVWLRFAERDAGEPGIVAERRP